MKRYKIIGKDLEWNIITDHSLEEMRTIILDGYKIEEEDES